MGEGFIKEARNLLVKKVMVREEVDEKEAERRMSICQSCDNYDQETERCKICTCIMPIKTKSKVNFNPNTLRNEITHCPVGNWGDLEISEFYKNL